MTREQYESLPLAELKGIAKTRGMKGTSTLKKGDLITRMLEKDEEVSRQEQIAQTEKFQKERQERYEQRQEQRELLQELRPETPCQTDRIHHGVYFFFNFFLGIAARYLQWLRKRLIYGKSRIQGRKRILEDKLHFFS